LIDYRHGGRHHGIQSSPKDFLYQRGGNPFDADKSWDEKKEFYRLSDKIVRTTHTTQSAIAKNGWTTVLAAAVFVL